MLGACAAQNQNASEGAVFVDAVLSAASIGPSGRDEFFLNNVQVSAIVDQFNESAILLIVSADQRQAVYAFGEKHLGDEVEIWVNGTLLASKECNGLGGGRFSINEPRDRSTTGHATWTELVQRVRKAP